MTHNPFYQNQTAEYNMIEFEASKYCPEFETSISQIFDTKQIYQEIIDEKNFQYKQKTALFIREELFYFMKEKVTSNSCTSLYFLLFVFKFLLFQCLLLQTGLPTRTVFLPQLGLLQYGSSLSTHSSDVYQKNLS